MSIRATKNLGHSFAEHLGDSSSVSRVVAAFACFSVLSQPQAVYGQQVPDSIKDALLKGYMSTCVPTIRNQMGGVASSQTKVTSYCACVGGKTFQNITQRQYEFIRVNAKLPPEIESMRISWRSQCNSLLD
jgi:hypothetical protein